MMIVDGSLIPASPELEVVTPFGRRKITHAFHDIDGTHSLIREWVPVMTLCTGYVATYGYPLEIQEAKEVAAMMEKHQPSEFPEGLKFSIESAGLSALTQMEWALRRAMQNGVMSLSGYSPEINDEIIARIWKGEEIFDDLPESTELRQTLRTLSTALFRAYEILLLKMGRDRNLADARIHQEKWRVPGSMEFLRFLQEHGVKNYFVTGAVVEYDDQGKAHGTMVDEVEALGFEIGPGKVIEKLVGSTWNEKLPKDKLMERICQREQLAGENLLVTGDGRSEVSAGVQMGALVMSRLNQDARRLHEIHRELGTNFIVERYDLSLLKQFFLA